MHLTPVAVACVAFGSSRKLAAAIGIGHGQVRRWKCAPDRRARGSGGDIPSPHMQRRILAAAKAQGLDLTAADLIEGRDVVSQTSK